MARTAPAICSWPVRSLRLSPVTRRISHLFGRLPFRCWRQHRQTFGCGGGLGFEPRLAESESAAPERPEGSRRPAPIVDRTNSPTVLQATMSSGAALVAASDLKVAGVMGI